MGRDYIIFKAKVQSTVSHRDDNENVFNGSHQVDIQYLITMLKQKYVNYLACSAIGSYAEQITFPESLFN